MSDISKILSAEACNRAVKRISPVSSVFMDAFFPGWKDNPLPADYVPWKYEPPSEIPPDDCEGCYGERQEASEELQLCDDKWLCGECAYTEEMER